MQVYNFRPMDVKDYFKPALSTADMNALEDAGVDHVQDGITHWFSRECDCVGCTAHYVFKITEDDRQFSGIVAHMTQPYALYCKEHQSAKVGPSLIRYTPKSAGASGGNGGSKGGKVTRRKQAGQRSNPRTSYAQQIAASHGWTLVKVGNRYYMTKEGEQARSFSNLDQVLDFVQQQAKAVA